MKVLTTSVNNPAFIELQANSVKKFVQPNSGDSVEFIVFNDAKDWNDYVNFGDTSINKNMVNSVCNSRFHVKCIDIPNDQHQHIESLVLRYADSLTFMTKYMIANPDKYLVIDSDMFFTSAFNMSQLDGYYFGYPDQPQISNGMTIYSPLPNMFYIDTTCIPNQPMITWNIDTAAIDTGGMNDDWLNTLDPSKVYKFSVLSSLNWTEKDIPNNIHGNIRGFLYNDPRNVNGQFFSEIYNNNIFHYKAGSNWMHKELQYLLNPSDPSSTMIKLNVHLTILLRQTFNSMT